MEFWIDSLDRLDLKGCFSLNVFFLFLGDRGGRGREKNWRIFGRFVPKFLKHAPRVENILDVWHYGRLWKIYLDQSCIKSL